MALATRLGIAAANAAALAVTGQLDGGTLVFYAGRRPASGDTPVTNQVKLAEVRFGTPAFALPQDGVVTAMDLTPDSDAIGGGKATWCRALSVTGMPIFDGTVGVLGRDSANVLMKGTTTIHPGAIVGVASLTYTQPLRDHVAL